MTNSSFPAEAAALLSVLMCQTAALVARQPDSAAVLALADTFLRQLQQHQFVLGQQAPLAVTNTVQAAFHVLVEQMKTQR